MSEPPEPPHDTETTRRRQAVYWRTIAATFDLENQAGNVPDLTEEIAADVDLPELVTDSDVSIDSLLQRYPELDEELDGMVNDPDVDIEEPIRRDILYSKLLLNVFEGPGEQETVTAEDYSQWSEDVKHFERACGYDPGDLLVPSGGQQRPGSGRGQQQPGQSKTPGEGQESRPGEKYAGRGTGSGPLVSEERLRRSLEEVEAEIIDHMALRETLKDRELAEQITPSMPMVEQLLREKSHLSDEALANAKRLIKQYIDDLADALEVAVEETDAGEIDYDQPPKRTFRNLDIQRTVWQNLPNWDPDEEKLYVEDLYFERKRTSTLPSRLIVVVDQSGSMVDSMVNCTILASIFAGLPHVDAHLLAYDTRAVDLSEYVDDPFEVLMKTDLGGGTDGMVAMPLVEDKIRNPDRTCVVWISDYYDSRKEALLEHFRDMDESGVTVIPVGSVTSSGYQSVDSWMKEQFADMGTPLVSGSVESLISEIKEFVG